MLTTRSASNIWGPHRQREQLIRLSDKYQFSRRLLAIILTEPKPPKGDAGHQDKHTFWPKPHRDDIELGAKSLDLPRPSTSSSQSNSFDHYSIAEQMPNYHAIDYGKRCKKFWCSKEGIS